MPLSDLLRASSEALGAFQEGRGLLTPEAALFALALFRFIVQDAIRAVQCINDVFRFKTGQAWFAWWDANFWDPPAKPKPQAEKPKDGKESDKDDGTLEKSEKSDISLLEVIFRHRPLWYSTNWLDFMRCYLKAIVAASEAAPMQAGHMAAFIILCSVPVAVPAWAYRRSRWIVCLVMALWMQVSPMFAYPWLAQALGRIMPSTGFIITGVDTWLFSIGSVLVVGKVTIAIVRSCVPRFQTVRMRSVKPDRFKE